MAVEKARPAENRAQPKSQVDRYKEKSTNLGRKRKAIIAAAISIPLLTGIVGNPQANAREMIPIPEFAPTILEYNQLAQAYDPSYKTQELKYKIKALREKDADISYLVNGFTGSDWVQLGLSTAPGANFYLIYEIWDKNGRPISPGNGAQGIVSFNGNVKEGDTMVMDLKISSGTVSMEITDLNTRAAAKKEVKAEGNIFIGGQPTPKGYFTGPLTERVSSTQGGPKLKQTFENLSPVVPPESNMILIQETSEDQRTYSNGTYHQTTIGGYHGFYTQENKVPPKVGGKKTIPQSGTAEIFVTGG